MNVTETAQFHAMAMAIDGRIKPLDDQGVMASAWQAVLEDVPFREARYILKALYAQPQMLVLQPGHAAKAWEELKSERERTVRSLLSLDSYLRAMEGQETEEIMARKRAQREKLLASLPPHARAEYESQPLAVTAYRSRVAEYGRKVADGAVQPWDEDPEMDPRFARVREALEDPAFGALGK